LIFLPQEAPKSPTHPFTPHLRILLQNVMFIATHQKMDKVDVLMKKNDFYYKMISPFSFYIIAPLENAKSQLLFAKSKA
jgi:hypothetical protein